MSARFSAWKAITAARLAALVEKYKSDERALEALNTLITKLKTLRSRDLATFIVLMHYAASTVPEIRALLPSEKEVFEWFERGEEDE